jgi:L-alanine-DL-glutamate epimerase-like enolase superfamily enzyme
MKIAAVESKHVVVPLGSGRGGSGATEVEVILVDVQTKEGVTGTGFSFALTGGGGAIKALIDQTLKDVVIGKDILEWERVWSELYNKTHRLGRGVSLPAISALDIAVWDLKAKAQNLPLYSLLGKKKESVFIYGSGRATHNMNIDQLVEGSLSYVKEGFTSVKLRAGQLGLHEDLKRIRAVREAVGDGIQLMVDCNERLTYADALWFGRKLEELDIYWMEEPVSSDDIASHKRLAEKLNVSIAVGEHLQGRFEFVNYIQNEAASIFQPDCPLVGGITEWKRIATISEAFGISISPHFLPELHIHLAASTDNCISIEHFPLIDDLLESTLEIEDGYAKLPSSPGIGMQWDEEKIKFFQKH